MFLDYMFFLLTCVWDGATCMCAHLPHLTQNEEQVFLGSTPFDNHCCVGVTSSTQLGWIDWSIGQNERSPTQRVCHFSLMSAGEHTCKLLRLKHSSRRRKCSPKTWLPEFIDIKLLITCLQWIILKQTHCRLKEEKTSFAYSPQIGEFEDV